MSRQKIRVSRGGSSAGRAVKRAVYHVTWAEAQAIAPGFHRELPYTTWKDLERRDAVSIAYLGPQLLQAAKVAKNVQSSPRTPRPPAYWGLEEDPVREQAKRDALMSVYRIFKATKGQGSTWELFVQMLGQWEASVSEKFARRPADERKRG